MKSNLYLRDEEMKFLTLSVLALLEDLNSGANNQNINWNPTARREMKEMISAGMSVKIKLEKLGIDMSRIQSYKKGDEDQFLTKES